MRFNEFDIVEAPGDNLQRKYNALIASLKKAGKDEGFFGRNSRRQENAELLAKFAQENGLSGMYDPETGNYVYSEENPDTGEVEVKTSRNASMDSAKDLAGKGLLPDVVKQRFTDQLADTTDIAGNERPEFAQDMQDIFQADAKARQKQEKSKVKTPNTQQFIDPDEEGTGIPKDIPEPPAASKKEPQPGDPNYPYKPGDYTGPDGIEDMSTGKIVKPDSKPAAASKPATPSTPQQTGGAGGEFATSKPAAASKPAARVSYQDLAKASGIKDANKIRVGQEIKLPGGGTYKVKKGDTLSGIAKNYNSGSIGKPAPSSATPPATSAPAAPSNQGGLIGRSQRIAQQRTAADDMQSPDDMMNQPVPAASAGAPTPTGGNQSGGVGPDGKTTKTGRTPPKKDDEPGFIERLGNLWRDFKGN